jgi:hypothetical protein
LSPKSFITSVFSYRDTINPSIVNAFAAAAARQHNTISSLIRSDHRHLNNIDCLKAGTACLVCFISIVNGHCKKERKRGLERLALVAQAHNKLQTLNNLFWTFDIYGLDPKNKRPALTLNRETSLYQLV